MSESIAALEQLLTSSPSSHFCLQEETIGAAQHKTFRRGPKTILEIYKKARALGDSAFVTGRETLSYREALRRAEQFAGALTTWVPLTKGDRVAIALPNVVESVVAFIGVTLTGATPVLMECRDEAFHLANCETTGCRVKISAIAPDRSIWCEDLVTRERRSWEELHQSAPGPVTWPNVERTDEAVIGMTSGTTGRPKGVVHTHVGVATGLMNMMLAASLSNPRPPPAAGEKSRPSRPATLLLAPWSHVSGYTQILLMMMLGGKLVVGEDLSVAEIAALIERERVRSVVGLTPAATLQLLSIAHEHDLSSLASFHINGFALHKNLVRAIAEKLPNVVVGTSYGLTETNGAVCALAGAALESRPYSCGRVLPTVDIRIVGDDGHESGPDEIGEIWIRGAMLLREYCGGGKDALREGWFRTGDSGALASDRFLTIVDRLRDTLLLGGRSLSCLAIERVLLERFDFDELSVCGMKGPQTATLRVAAVPGRQPTTAAEVQYLLRAQFGVASVVSFHTDLPRNASGKIDQSLLLSA